MVRWRTVRGIINIVGRRRNLLSRDAMLAVDMCLSVCHKPALYQWQNVGSRKQHRTIADGITDAKFAKIGSNRRFSTNISLC